jgi:anti-sigma B factor antagonist
MKRHLTTASALRVGTGEESGTSERAPSRTHAALKQSAHTHPPSSEPRLALASVRVRTHRLILTGELDHRSAPALEAEIERLCEEGVTGITLDLRGLTYIDSIGVAVVAFRCGLCKRRGYDFSVIPGSRLVHRAFEQAGLTELLPFQRDGDAAPRLPALALGHRSRDDCEQ